jgi:Zc3h12a-like Ribonuclease NYN domain
LPLIQQWSHSYVGAVRTTDRRWFGSSASTVDYTKSTSRTILDHNEITLDTVENSKPVTQSILGEIAPRQRQPTIATRPVTTTLQQTPNTISMPTSVKDGGASSTTSNHFDATLRTRSPRVQAAIPLRTQSSLFDVFQVPDPPALTVAKNRSPNAFPEEAVTQYWEIVEPILTSENFQKKHTNKPISDAIANPVMEWLRADAPALLYDLPTFQDALKGSIEPSQRAELRVNFRAELHDQRARFCKHLGLVERQHRLALTGLNVGTSMCARHGKGLPVEVIWEKIKEAGILDQPLLLNLLYVSSTFSTGSVRSRRKRRSKYGHLAGIASILDVLDVNNQSEDQDCNENESDLVDLTDEIAIYHDLLYDPTEQSINVRVKLLVAQGKAEEAQTLLDEQSSGEAQLRLRAYTPVLRLFIELDDVSSALMLFRKMRDIPSVHLDVETYIHLIAGIAEKGRFCVGAEPIASAKELGYQHMSGPGLFDELVTEMASAIYEIPESSAKRLYNALASGFPDSGLTEAAVHSLKLTNEKANDDELFASRVRINQSTGFCPRSGIKLRLITLRDDEKKKLVEKVLVMAQSEQSKFQERNNYGYGRKSSEEQLFNFYKWLDQREGRPFTIFIDGANVAYFHQNFEDGRFCFHQVKFLVDFLERSGENPLVVLPNKYSANVFNVSHGAPGAYRGDRQVLTKEEVKVRDSLIRFGKVFFVPGGNLGTSVCL